MVELEHPYLGLLFIVPILPYLILSPYLHKKTSIRVPF